MIPKFDRIMSADLGLDSGNSRASILIALSFSNSLLTALMLGNREDRGRDNPA